MTRLRMTMTKKHLYIICISTIFAGPIWGLDIYVATNSSDQTGRATLESRLHPAARDQLLGASLAGTGIEKYLTDSPTTYNREPYGIDFKGLPLDRRFYLLNVLCQLDEPGEWYYDSQNNILYLWPVQIQTHDSAITIAGGPPLLEADGTEHVIIRDIIFEIFGERGVQFHNVNHVLFAGCTFRSGIGQGLSLRYGVHNGITGCDFYNLESAFSLTGTSANRQQLIAEHNFATNNHIHHCRRRGYGMISIGGVGIRFANNLLHNQNGGMFYGDNDAVIERNEFYDMGYEMGDWNVAYNGADLTKINNTVRFNFVHHLMETPRGYPIAAWRADDGGSGLRAHANLYYKCGRSAVEFHGPANEIIGNVVMKTQHLWWTFQRPYEKIPKSQFIQEQRELDREIRGTYVKEDLIGKAEKLLGKSFWTSTDVTCPTRRPIAGRSVKNTAGSLLREALMTAGRSTNVTRRRSICSCLIRECIRLIQEY